MIQLLLVGFRYALLHSLHVLFLGIGLHQSTKILAGGLQNRSRMSLKRVLESVVESNKPFRQSIDIIYACISRMQFAFLASL
jgi:hypothetical protein